MRLTSPRPRITENDVEKACLDYLATRGYWTVRLHAGVFRTLDGNRVIHGVPKGTPDYAVLHATFRGFFMEVKRPKEVPSEAQLFMYRRLKVCGIIVAVVESSAALIDWVREFETYEGGRR